MHLQKSHRKKGRMEKGFFVEAKKKRTMSIFVYIYVRQSASKTSEQAPKKRNERRLRLGLCRGQNPSFV